MRQRLFQKRQFFEVGIVVILEEIMVGIEIEKIGGLGHGQEKEKEE